MTKHAIYKNEVRPGLWFVKEGKGEPEYWIEGGPESGIFFPLTTGEGRAMWVYPMPQPI